MTHADPAGRPISGGPRSTVVVITWRGAAVLGACLDGLARQTRPVRILVVDNASTDGSAAIAAAHPSTPDILRLPGNRGYAGGLAAALRRVGTEFTGWLNDDAVVPPHWLAACEDALDAAPGTAAVGSVLVDERGAVLSHGVRLTADGHGADVVTAGAGPAFGFCGGAALLRTAALRACGGLPAGFFCYYEDTDTAWRLRLAGHEIGMVDVPVRHGHGASAGHGSWLFHRWNERNRLLMLLRCAPLPVAAGQLARFTALTGALALRRRPPGGRPPNLTTGLRGCVLAEIIARLPVTLARRRRLTTGLPASRARRRALWSHWPGR
jgi:GT2 family glycosyltransferase